ncbi:MAG: TVP38/TMEM64 family protein [Terricaulis sp.]
MEPTKPNLNLPRVAGLVILGVVTLIGFAAPFLPPDFAHGLGPWLLAARAAPWAPFAAVLAYAVFATLGVPQIVLITATVVAFGPWLGFLCAWTGKMLACSLGFVVGRRFGAGILARHASPRVAHVMQQLAKQGFWASALIRLVPTIPSVLVNIAAGATPMRFRDFIAGTAVGSVPKMALYSFGGAAAMEAMHDNSVWSWAMLGGFVLLYLALGYAGRRWLKQNAPPAPQSLP